jgi:putative Mg2+ transporter-C (MgtC) family protein
MTAWTVFERLAVSLILAGVIGYERERHGRAAGFRTHILVSLGSCLMMLTGIAMQQADGGHAVDPSRLAAQVVSGIGFLGAGTILRFRATVRGLTTAASLWVVAGIGLAAGCGFLIGAVIASGMAMLTLFGLSQWERSMRREWYCTLMVETSASANLLPPIRQALSEHEVEVYDFEVKTEADASTSKLLLHMRLQSDTSKPDIVQDVLRVRGVIRAHWE